MNQGKRRKSKFVWAVCRMCWVSQGELPDGVRLWPMIEEKRATKPGLQPSSTFLPFSQFSSSKYECIQDKEKGQTIKNINRNYVSNSLHKGGFPPSSVSKESACNAGDPSLMHVSGRSPGEGNGNLLQYSCLENPMHRGAWQATVHGVTRVGHNLVTKPPPPHKGTIDTLKEK